MIGILVALAYGLVAGLFAPVAVFGAGLIMGLTAFSAIEYGASTLPALALQALFLLIAAQLGYATSVFLRATLLKSRIDATTSSREKSNAAAGDNLRGMSD